MDSLHIDPGDRSGQVTLVIFLADALECHLVGAIEAWLREQTACAPIARQPFSFTPEALARFYPGLTGISADDLQLLSRIFCFGPCLASLWFGKNAAEVIPAIKGATHPAHCSASVLRGRFWCESPCANLVHISDDGVDMARELEVLRALEPHLFVGRLPTRDLSPFHDAVPPAPRHSGTLTLCSVISTLLSAQGSRMSRLELPDDGNARETMARAEAWLEQARTMTAPVIAEAIGAYLDGTADPSRFVATLMDAARIDPWEELMLRSGILSRAEWLKVARTLPAERGS